MLSFLSNFKHTVLNVNACLQDVLRALTWGGQAVFFVDENNKLLSSMSDGDLRRALISGATLECIAFPFSKKTPIFGTKYMSEVEILNLMNINLIRAIPIIDEKRCVIKIAFATSKSNYISPVSNLFFIFAGGRGERMRPYTDQCPKPMLKVAGKPMLLHIIEKAKSEGFFRFIIATNYLSEVIKDYFGNGKKFEVEISYLNEKKPLGTAGALSLVRDPFHEPILITNGDVLTELSYKSILNYHKESKADACVALVKEFEKLKYGVVKVTNGDIISIEEKPTVSRLVNAGVYVLSPDIISLLKYDEKINITTFLSEMIASGKKVIGYQLHENWSDIGYPKDLKNANYVYRDSKHDI